MKEIIFNPCVLSFTAGIALYLVCAVVGIVSDIAKAIRRKS